MSFKKTVDKAIKSIDADKKSIARRIYANASSALRINNNPKVAGLISKIIDDALELATMVK